MLETIEYGKLILIAGNKLFELYSKLKIYKNIWAI